jgi:hypothetical protein
VILLNANLKWGINPWEVRDRIQSKVYDALRWYSKVMELAAKTQVRDRQGCNPDCITGLNSCYDTGSFELVRVVRA